MNKRRYGLILLLELLVILTAGIVDINSTHLVVSNGFSQEQNIFMSFIVSNTTALENIIISTVVLSTAIFIYYKLTSSYRLTRFRTFLFLSIFAVIALVEVINAIHSYNLCMWYIGVGCLV